MKRIKQALLTGIFCASCLFTLAQSGGETCVSATVIGSLPFSGQGTTVGAVDDYYESCPDVGNQGGAPDHVYRYDNGNALIIVDVSLCEAVTDYDSQLYIYEGSCGGTLIGCQEDGCQSPAYSAQYNSTISGVPLQANTSYYFVIDGYDAGSSGNYQLDVSISNITTPDSSEIPLVYINSSEFPIPDEPKAFGTMQIIDNGPGNMNHPTDPPYGYDGFIGIEQRGSSSAMFPKKSYGLETRDEFGFNRNVSIFGMPSENDWVLHGPYSDKTLMRNELAYYMGRQLSGYCPRTQLCELTINGVYQGVYLFMEKIKRDNGRVNISRMLQTDIMGDSLTGGYIIKIDKNTGATNGSWFSQYSTWSANPQQVEVLYHYPKPDSIVPAQQTYIQAYFDAFEDRLNGPNYQDASLGYRALADINSFVDYFLLTEALRNVDGYRISTYLTKNRDSQYGKLRIGPPWDYNLALGNANYCNGGELTGWAYQFNDVCPGDNWQVPFWWERLMTDPEFTNRLRCRWDELRAGPYHTDSIFAHIDSNVALLSNAQQRNFDRWDILNTYVWPNNTVAGSYDAEILYLKNWITNRLAWLDTNLPGSNGDCTFLSVEETGVPVALRVFPNPTEGDFFVEFTSHTNNSTLTVSDINGRVMWEKRINSSGQIVLQSASHPALQELQSGIYFVTLTAENQSVSHKFVRK
ncbi:MAG: CotH kinase family protein [bacterium]|nr:CotH kinase family protein [bacterium]